MYSKMCNSKKKRLLVANIHSAFFVDSVCHSTIIDDFV